MVSAALIVQHVLNELKAGNADCIEAQVIGAAGVAHGQSRNAEILKRSNPLRKNWRYSRVSLQINAANLASTVIHVEVGRDQLLLRLHFQRTCCSPHEFGESQLVGRS